MSQTSTTFLDAQLLQRLDQAALSAKHRIRGTLQGKRCSSQLGASLDFADYRLYTPGDDIRQLDWNAYGRTGKPFIKLFMDEQELIVNLYIDASKSMDFGSQGQQGISTGTNKFLYARQLAACIGYLTLSGYDRVSARLFGERIHEQLPMLRGKGSVQRLFQFLAAAQPTQRGDLSAAVRRPEAIPRLPGMTWLFSDFLYENGVEEALSYLRAAKQEVVAVQVLSPHEVNPSLSGDVRLVDSELGSGKEVAISGALLKAYRAAVQRYTESLRRFCHERDIAYILVTTDTPLTDTVFRTLRQGGFIR